VHAQTDVWSGAKSTARCPGSKWCPAKITATEFCHAMRSAATFRAANAVGNEIEAAYQRALNGIRATLRGEQPNRPEDPFFCGTRPRCFWTLG
jgi:hypothetical protein